MPGPLSLIDTFIGARRPPVQPSLTWISPPEGVNFTGGSTIEVEDHRAMDFSSRPDHRKPSLEGLGDAIVLAARLELPPRPDAILGHLSAEGERISLSLVDGRPRCATDRGSSLIRLSRCCRDR